MKIVQKSLSTVLAVMTIATGGVTVSASQADAHSYRHHYKHYKAHCGWRTIWKRTHRYHHHKHKIRIWVCR